MRKAALLLALVAAARAAEPQDLAEPLRAVLARHDVPALGGAIVTRDGLVALGAAGVRKRGADAAVTKGDLWHLGSCTKSMTATLCAVLVEKGTLSWDRTLAASFPDLKDRMHADYAPVPLELLLRNRGGAPHEVEPALWARLWKHGGPPADARRALAEGVLAAPPQAKPGTEFVYSNAGFAIAGHMAETATGKSWEELMRAELFGPLGIESAGFGPPGARGQLDQPWGHGADGKPVDHVDNPPAIGPAGTVHMSLADWARYVALHLRAEGLLRPETFRRLHTPPDGEDYACGWMRPERAWAGGRVLTHAGSNTMWYCVVWAAPAKGFAVLATCNQGGEDAAKACDDVASALVRMRR